LDFHGRTCSIGCIGGRVFPIEPLKAMDTDRYNRMLHEDEKAVIKVFASGDAGKEHRLEAAGCALVHCAAEFAPGTADYAKYSALEQEGAGYTVEQAQLKSYSGTLFSTAGYGGMVRQTSGGSLFQYTVDDAKADGSAFLSNVFGNQPGKIDYVTIGGGAFGAAAGISLNLRNGNVYIGGSGAVPVGVGGGAITIGVVPSNANLPPKIQAKNIDNFLNGGAFGGNGCAFGVCIGGAYSIGGTTSAEVGIGFGGLTRSLNFSGGTSVGATVPVGSVPGTVAGGNK
jgi:filamentous hemagglutinin